MKILFRSLLTFCLLFSLAVRADLADEIEAGAKQHKELMETMRLYTDERLNTYVTTVGNKLASNSSMANIPWHFFIVDDEAINAFATQGGYVYIHRGLMTYLTSEAQLAAVLSHEISHVTERHLIKQRSAAGLGKLAAFVSSIAMMNSDVGQAIDLWNTARLSGYGRDMELEADEVGAEVLYRSGYEPQAIIEVLSLLKDHESFTNKLSGGRNSTYHGVFATHPRSDQRLQEVVGQAGQLPPGEAFRGRDEYRRAMDGQVFGVNANANAQPGFQRFGHRGLGITLVYPEGWTLSINGAEVTLASAQYAQRLTLQVERMQDVTVEPKMLLEQRYQGEAINSLVRVYDDAERRDDGRTGIATREWGKQRVAVIKIGGNAYYFESSEPTIDDEVDKIFVNIIASFRRANEADYPPANIKQIYYRRLEPGETFIDLAREASSLGQFAEDQLRLINGYYPSGQPQPGTWLKLVERKP